MCPEILSPALRAGLEDMKEAFGLRDDAEQVQSRRLAE
jgi:hypothetical protein